MHDQHADGSTDTGPDTIDTPAPPPKYVLFYDSSEQACDLAPVHFPAHERWLAEFRATGELLAVGTFADPFRDGSMTVFTSRDAVDRFVEGDPFRTEGVIRGWRVMEWHETLLAAAPAAT